LSRTTCRPARACSSKISLIWSWLSVQYDRLARRNPQRVAWPDQASRTRDGRKPTSALRQGVGPRRVISPIAGPTPQNRRCRGLGSWRCLRRKKR
jgi:hypothetical protein